MENHIIEAQALYKKFGKVYALENISFKIKKNGIYTIFGENGSGKSTLIKILSLTMKPFSGKIKIFGISQEDLTQSIMKKIGVIYHEPLLYPDLTGYENLIFSGKMLGIENPEENITQYAEIFKIKEKLKERVKYLSRGQKQRLSLVRAFYHNPELLLLDEPFAGLDEEGCRILEELFKKFKQKGKTILFATHRKDFGLSLSEETIFLHKGKIHPYKT